jgi:hypothetical protein
MARITQSREIQSCWLYCLEMLNFGVAGLTPLLSLSLIDIRIQTLGPFQEHVVFLPCRCEVVDRSIVEVFLYAFWMGCKMLSALSGLNDSFDILVIVWRGSVSLLSNVLRHAWEHLGVDGALISN